MENDNTAVPESVEEVVVTDQDLYDHAMSNEPEPQPAEAPAQAEAQPESEQGQGRDEKGRFAPKATQPETPAPNLNAQQPQPKPLAQQPQPQPQPEHRVPVRELVEERNRRQALEKQVAQLTEAFNYIRQNGLQQQPQQQQPQQPPNPQQLFEQPDQYLQQNVIAPLRDWGTREMLLVRDGLSRDYAVDKFGEKVVNDAFEAIKTVRNTPDGDFAYRTIMAAGNPYKALVEWHKKQRAYQALGNDPDAWLKQKQQEWLNDPAAQKAMVELLRRQQQSSPKAQAPNVNLPPSLSSMPASSGRVESVGDLSDASLFAHAMK